MNKGYIQVYTGNGKGKTTAAIGVCARALANGMKVFFAQFIKGKVSSEFITLEKGAAGNLEHHLYGLGRFIVKDPEQEDIAIAKKGLEECGAALASGDYDIVFMDEANGALKAKLFAIDELMKVVSMKDENTELIITGRNAHHDLIEAADLVTEMKEIKHYYSQGVLARKGIEK